MRIEKDNAVNVANRWGVFRVRDVTRDSLGQPVMVLVESESATLGRFELWITADEVTNVRTVKRWADDY